MSQEQVPDPAKAEIIQAAVDHEARMKVAREAGTLRILHPLLGETVSAKEFDAEIAVRQGMVEKGQIANPMEFWSTPLTKES